MHEEANGVDIPPMRSASSRSCSGATSQKHPPLISAVEFENGDGDESRHMFGDMRVRVSHRVTKITAKCMICSITRLWRRLNEYDDGVT